MSPRVCVSTHVLCRLTAQGAHVHVETGRTIEAHPLDEYFAEVIRRVRWERRRAEQKKKELVVGVLQVERSFDP